MRRRRLETSRRCGWPKYRQDVGPARSSRGQRIAYLRGSGPCRKGRWPGNAETQLWKSGLGGSQKRARCVKRGARAALPQLQRSRLSVEPQYGDWDRALARNWTRCAIFLEPSRSVGSGFGALLCWCSNRDPVQLRRRAVTGGPTGQRRAAAPRRRLIWPCRWLFCVFRRPVRPQTCQHAARMA